jgi:hypothetical protein
MAFFYSNRPLFRLTLDLHDEELSTDETKLLKVGHFLQLSAPLVHPNRHRKHQPKFLPTKITNFQTIFAEKRELFFAPPDSAKKRSVPILPPTFERKGKKRDCPGSATSDGRETKVGSARRFNSKLARFVATARRVGVLQNGTF